MEPVIKPFYMINLIAVGIFRNSVFPEFGDVIVYVIIIVREVLERVDFIRQPVLKSLSKIDIRFMGIERTVGIRSVQMPSPAAFVGHDIDDTSQSIRAESYGNYTFIYFDAFGEVDRNVIDVESRTGSFLRHSVDKYLHMFARKTVQHQLHIRAYAARLTQFQSRKLHQGFAQAFGRVV